VGRLSDNDLRDFGHTGYVIVRDVVPEDLLRAADNEIDQLLKTVSPDEGSEGPGTNLWFRPRAELPRCEEALRQSGALGTANELVAPYELDHAFDHIQVATTLPPWNHVPGGPHIDGHSPSADPPGSFTLLAGILLSDQSASAAGNLWIWPGSHFKHQQLFTERGTRVLNQTHGHPTLLEPPLELGPGVEIRAGRGDLLLSHYLTGHNKGGNTSPHVRRTVYYRLAVQGHADRWEQTFLDPLTEFPRVRRALRVR
jgi:Phytanoyl-CoA dioxygenase (PhyH)